MAKSADDQLETTTGALVPNPVANPFVPQVERGEALPRTLGRPALEQHWAIPADRRSFEHPARIDGPGRRHLERKQRTDLRKPSSGVRGGAVDLVGLGSPTAVRDARHVDTIRELGQFDGQRGDRVLVQPRLPGLDQPQPPPAHGPQQLTHVRRCHLQGTAVVDDQRQGHFAGHKRGW